MSTVPPNGVSVSAMRKVTTMLRTILLAGILSVATGVKDASDKVVDSTPVVAIRCAEPLTEDTAANVRLVAFERSDDGTLSVVYRCERKGF